MRKYLHFVMLFVLLFLALPIVGKTVNAASFSFEKSTVNIKKNDTFTLQVLVDPKTEQITSVDIYVTYDKAILSADSVQVGSYFPTVLDDIQPGKVYIAGLVEDPSAFKTGVGTIATITFKAIADGTANVSYDCRSASDSSKIIKNDINATNVITCSDNKSSLVTVGSTTSLPTTSGGNGTGSTTPTTTPVPTSAVTSTPTPTITPIPTRIATNSATLSAAPVSGNADTAMALLIPGVLFMLFAGVMKVVGRI